MALGEKSELHPLSPRVLWRFLAVCAPVLLLFGGVALVLYDQEAINETTVHARDAVHIVDLQHGITSRQFEAIESDLLYLAGEKLLQDYLSGVAGTSGDVAEDFALFLRRKGIYDQIRYLDERGMETIRVNAARDGAVVVDERDLQSKAHRSYFIEARELARGRIFVSAFDLNVEHGRIERPLKPVVRFATRVFDADGRGRGILVLNYLGATVIGELQRASASFPGRVMLVNPEGFWIHGPSPDDDWGFLLGKARTFGTEYPEAWSTVSRGGAGQFTDAGGLFTFRTVRRPERRARGGGDPAPPGEAPRDREAAGAELFTIVSHVPSSELHVRSDRLLDALLRIGAVGFVLVAIFVWFAARMSVQHRISEQKLKGSEARLRAMSMRLATAREDDRRRISRDLHDDLGQIVTVIILDLQRSVQADDPVRKQEIVARALRGSEQLLERVREISSRLRPRALDELGLQDAVEGFLAELEARTGVEVRADLTFGSRDVPPAVSENVFRIVQEALTNVCKHAEVKQASLTLRVSEARVTVSVRDEGVGFRPGSMREKALGIVGMGERVELLGGEFRVRSEPGEGTEISVSIPLGEA